MPMVLAETFGPAASTLADAICKPGDCSKCARTIHLDDSREWLLDDGTFIKELFIPERFVLVAQHSHASDHTSWLQSGAVGIWIEGKPSGIKVAPCDIFIPKGIMHEFMSLQPETVIYCIHESVPTVLAENAVT